MPKLLCLCGFEHNLSPIPDHGYITVRDVDYENMIGAHIVQYDIAGHGLPVERDERYLEWFEANRSIISFHGVMYECPKCGRLLWERPGSKNQFDCFTPEPNPTDDSAST